MTKHDMMTSSNGNISPFRVLCEGNPQVANGFPWQRPVTETFDVFFDVRLNRRLRNSPVGGDLRRHGAHCAVTVMNCVNIFYGCTAYKWHRWAWLLLLNSSALLSYSHLDSLHIITKCMLSWGQSAAYYVATSISNPCGNFKGGGH